MSQLSSFNVRALLCHECDGYRFRNMESTIAHARAGMVCFKTQAFAEEEIIRFYYVSLSYKTLP